MFKLYNFLNIINWLCCKQLRFCTFELDGFVHFGLGVRVGEVYTVGILGNVNRRIRPLLLFVVFLMVSPILSYGSVFYPVALEELQDMLGSYNVAREFEELNYIFMYLWKPVLGKFQITSLEQAPP